MAQTKSGGVPLSKFWLSLLLVSLKKLLICHAINVYILLVERRVKGSWPRTLCSWCTHGAWSGIKCCPGCWSAPWKDSCNADRQQRWHLSREEVLRQWGMDTRWGCCKEEDRGPPVDVPGMRSRCGQLCRQRTQHVSCMRLTPQVVPSHLPWQESDAKEKDMDLSIVSPKYPVACSELQWRILFRLDMRLYLCHLCVSFSSYSLLSLLACTFNYSLHLCSTSRLYFRGPS